MTDIMKALEEKILQEGVVVDGDILKVDGFVNHQVDVPLMEEIGKDMAEHFKEQGITKVFTIESSGIAPALFTAKELGVPLVILKKQQTAGQPEDRGVADRGCVLYEGYLLSADFGEDYISDEDHVLIIDDFLANGEAATGAIRLIRKAHATVAGLGVLIEKAFQPGHEKLESQGIHVYAQASIQAFEDGKVVF